MFRIDRVYKTLLLATLAPLTFASSAWASLPSSFIYQGHLADANGNAVTSTVSIKFQILAPNNCLLYEEQQNGLNLSATQGHFTLAVGSPLASPKRTGNDPALGMKQIFSNPPTQLRGVATTCPSGYTPASGDVRKLRVIVIDGNGEDALTPDQPIHSVPFATTAETLQGKQPGDFIQNTVGSMQSILEQIASGTSALYLRTDGANATNVSMNNQRMTSLADPTNAQDAATKNYCDTKLAGQNVITSGLAQGSFLVWNTSTSRWEPGNLTSAGVRPHALAAHAACATNQASRWDGSTWSCVAAGGGGGGTGGGATTNTNAQEVVTLTNSSTKVHQSNFIGGGAYVLPAANGGLALGGPLFTFFNQNQIYTLPILNADGKFVGGVYPNGITNVFLFDTSTTGGKWATDGTWAIVGVEKVVVDTSGPTNINNYTWGLLAPNKIIVLYHLPGSSQGMIDVFARILDVNTSTKTVTWGTPTVLATDAPNSGLSLTTISSSLAVVEYGAGVKKVLSASGSSVTASADLSFNCPGHRAKLANNQLICLQTSNGSIDIHINTFDATSVTSTSGTASGLGSGSFQPGQATMLNGRLLIPYYRNDTPMGLYMIAVNLSDFSHQSVLLDGNYIDLSSPTPFLSSYIPIDSTNLWYFPNTNFGWMNTKKAYKINWDGSTLSTPLAVNVEGSRVFQVGGDYFIEQTMGTLPNRQRVNNISSLSLDPAVRTFPSHPRYAPDRSFTLTTNYLDGQKMTLLFEVGY